MPLSAPRRLALAAALLSSACGAHRIELPTDPGTPFADAASVHALVSRDCRQVQTMTAEVSLSGRAGDDRLRGTVHAAFKRPSSMLLQLVAGPFGTVGFVLGADAAGATLLLPRSDQVVRGAADEIMGALTGLPLAPGDLQAILTGCVRPDPVAVGGRRHPNGWASIDLEGDATVYVQRTGDRWRLWAARQDDWRIEYTEWPERAAFPARVRIVREGPVAVDLQARLAQVETNVELDDSTFRIMVPADAKPITVEDLRRAGPLQGEAP